MERLYPKLPVSLGLLMTYRCNIACRYCIYASGPGWDADWLSEEDAEIILKQLSGIFNNHYGYPATGISFGYGLHFTGGEPFLNFELLLKLSGMAKKYDIPFPFVETNCFWAKDDRTTIDRLVDLRDAGLTGIMISVNPFSLENVSFEKIDRAYRTSRELFKENTMVYQQFFLELFRNLKISGKLKFEELLKKIDPSLLKGYIELLPMGKTPYQLDFLYDKFPASSFFGQNCRDDLTREWHMHIDNYCNYVPGYCAGISLGDARDLKKLSAEGIDLERHPVLKAIATDLKELYNLGVKHGYSEKKDGYISKCHLCEDIRKHLVKNPGGFSELKPEAFYENLCL